MEEINIEKAWSETLESIKVSVSPAIFQTWFLQTYILSVQETEAGRVIINIGCPSSYVKNTLETRYLGFLQETILKTTSINCDLLFVIKPKPIKSDDKKSPLFDALPSPQSFNIDLLQKARLRLNYTFDAYAVSSSNQMAWAASDAVSKNLGGAYNPLFIWGGVGVGKTHLMTAIGLKALESNSDNGVYFCTGEDFTNDIVDGIRNKTTQQVRNKYRKLNLLLVDDIQFIAGKEGVQEEFFHTFNALVSNNSQVVMTSDKPPSDISKLEERLRSRFEAGLIVDIAQPDFELRCAIIQIKSKQRGLSIPDHMIHLIAGNIDTPRKIEGFLVKLMSEALAKKQEITDELVETLISKGDDINGKPQAIRAGPDDVIDAVVKYYSIGKRKLLGESRTRPVSTPRQVLMYFLRTQLQIPLEEVGRIVGGRDHTTVMHGVEKITRLASNSVQIREDIRGIKNLI